MEKEKFIARSRGGRGFTRSGCVEWRRGRYCTRVPVLRVSVWGSTRSQARRLRAGGLENSARTDAIYCLRPRGYQ